MHYITFSKVNQGIVYLCREEHIANFVGKASSLGQANGSNFFSYCLAPRVNLRTPRTLSQSLLCANEKNTPALGRIVKNQKKRICAFSGAPRWAIINCPFCLTCIPFRKFRKAKRSLSFAAPTLKSSSIHPVSQTKMGRRCLPIFIWRREEDLNLRYVSGVHTISNRAP